MTENLHRLLALALLLAAGMLIHWLVTNVWLDRYRYYQNNIEQAQERLQRFDRLAAERPALEQRLQQLSQENRTDEFYLAQTAPNLAATELQQQVKAIVESNGGRLASTQVLPVGSENGFTRVAIRVQLLVTDMTTLQRSLHALESAEPLLFIDQVQMRAREVRKRLPVSRDQIARNRALSRAERRARRQVRQVTTETQLTAQFELAGFLRKNAAAGAGS